MAKRLTETQRRVLSDLQSLPNGRCLRTRDVVPFRWHFTNVGPTHVPTATMDVLINHGLVEVAKMNGTYTRFLVATLTDAGRAALAATQEGK